MNNRVAVLGGTGFVGRNILVVLRSGGVVCQSASRSEGTDLRDVAAFRMLLREIEPDVSRVLPNEHGVRSIHFLVPNMYGPYDSTDPNKAHALNALIAKLVKAQNDGRDEIIVWGTGIAIREWLFAKDFARIVRDVIGTPGRLGLSEPLNVAQNFGLSVRELVGLMAAAVGFSGRISYDPTMPDGAPRKVMDDRKVPQGLPEFRVHTFGTRDRGDRRVLSLDTALLRAEYCFLALVAAYERQDGPSDCVRAGLEGRSGPVSRAVRQAFTRDRGRTDVLHKFVEAPHAETASRSSQT